jgi:predicted metal-binding membrane protein
MRSIALSLKPTRHNAAGVGITASAILLLFAAAGWWWSARTADDMGSGAMRGMDGMSAQTAMSFGAFVVAWVAMMAAMMLPAIMPVVKLYAHAAARGRAAPTAFFVLGYVVVWSAMAIPAYLAWRALATPLTVGESWVGRLAGATFLAAAIWQGTPLKTVCLRHCRSPLGFFLRFGSRIHRPRGATRMGLAHGAFCLGCCWPLFAVLIVLGTMDLLWMAVLTTVIVLEKNTPRGEQIAHATGVALAAVGILLLAHPSFLAHLT